MTFGSSGSGSGKDGSGGDEVRFPRLAENTGFDGEPGEFVETPTGIDPRDVVPTSLGIATDDPIDSREAENVAAARTSAINRSVKDAAGNPVAAIGGAGIDGPEFRTDEVDGPGIEAPDRQTYTAARVRAAVSTLPRYALSHLPTPLEFLPRFSAALGGPRVYIKRDDCTGLAFGGNKARHNEFILGDAIASGSDMFVWGAGLQSNNCRQTAAACARAGLDCLLLLSRVGHEGEEESLQGNLLLDHLVGADVRFVDAKLGPELDALLAATAAEYRHAGRKPYFWDRPRVTPLAAVSYIVCATEMLEQSIKQGVLPTAVYVSSAGATGAGLAAGIAALGWQPSLQCIAPMTWPWDTATDMANTANDALRQLNLNVRLTPAEIDVDENHIAPAYGQCSADGLEALTLLARTEGILVDPIYSGKALAGLIADVRSGRYRPDEAVVFVHTGGTPALFAYNSALRTGVPARQLRSGKSTGR